MSKLALVIVDMQNAYFRNDALDAKRQQLVRACNELIEHAIQHDIPIFNIITEHKPDRSTWTLNMLEDGEGYLFESEPETENVPRLNITSAITVVKTRDSAFYETTLAEVLRFQQIDGLILAGVSTHTCVLQTAADAYAEDFKVLIAKEAVASHDMSFHHKALTLLEQEYRQRSYKNKELFEVIG